MATIDLRRLPADEFVLHFGGRTKEVDAYTFSNSLLALAEAMQEINRQLNPDRRVEISIEAVGERSFRAKIKAASKPLTSLFARGVGGVVVGVLSTLIYDKYVADNQVKLIVNDDSYVVERGGDRIIMPKQAWEAKEKLPNPQVIQEKIAKTFDILDGDPSVTDFGLAAHIEDKEPVGVIPRSEFLRLAAVSTPEPEEDDSRTHVDEPANLVVLKATLEKSDRCWQFVWNGIKISAPIKDPTFFDRLARREFEFGQGDVLSVTLRIYRVRDEVSGAFLNERYEVSEVKDYTPGPRQVGLDLSPRSGPRN